MKTKATKGLKRKATPKSKISTGAWQLIREEARSLGMTQDEYVRLTSNLFATLRKTLAKEQKVDGQGLLQLVENPLFGAVMQYLATQVTSAPESKEDPGSETSSQRPNPPGAIPPGGPSPYPRPANGVPVQRYDQQSIPPEWQFW